MQLPSLHPTATPVTNYPSRVTVISIVRLHFALQPVSSDFTWNYVDLGLWSDTEAPIGLLSVCLPTYGGLFRKLLARLRITKLTPSELAPTSHIRTHASDKRRSLRTSTTLLEDTESAAWFKELEHEGAQDSNKYAKAQPGFIVVTRDVKVTDEKESGRGSSCDCSAETPTKSKRLSS